MISILISGRRHKNSVLQLSFETQSSYINICFSVSVFAELLNYWNSFTVTFLPIKIKRYLHVPYMQLFDYLGVHNITYITRLTLS